MPKVAQDLKGISQTAISASMDFFADKSLVDFNLPGSGKVLQHDELYTKFDTHGLHR
jgi:hypothetical protein